MQHCFPFAPSSSAPTSLNNKLNCPLNSPPGFRSPEKSLVWRWSIVTMSIRARIWIVRLKFNFIRFLNDFFFLLLIHSSWQAVLAEIYQRFSLKAYCFSFTIFFSFFILLKICLWHNCFSQGEGWQDGNEECLSVLGSSLRFILLWEQRLLSHAALPQKHCVGIEEPCCLAGLIHECGLWEYRLALPALGPHWVFSVLWSLPGWGGKSSWLSPE